MLNKNIRKIIRESIRRKILERSSNVYDRFVDEIKSFAELASNRKLNQRDYEDFIEKYSLSPDLNPDEIVAIVKNSETDEQILQKLQGLYTKITVSNSPNQQFQAADPKSRVGSAKIIDKLMKQIWQSEAKNYPDFWSNFETWHAVGGIVGGENVDYSVYYNFPNSYMLDELSCYGAPGNSSDTLNPLIQEMMLNNPGLGWATKVHFRIKGDITFAAHYDIVTEWLKLKKENDPNNFKKHANFAKIALNSESLIVGPEDKITDKEITGDNYNEIVVQGGFVNGVCCDVLLMLGLSYNADFETIINKLLINASTINDFYKTAGKDKSKDKAFAFKYKRTLLNLVPLMQNLPKFAKLLNTFHKSYPFYDIKTGKKLSDEIVYIIKENAKILPYLQEVSKDESVFFDEFQKGSDGNPSYVYNGVNNLLGKVKVDMAPNKREFVTFYNAVASHLPLNSFNENSEYSLNKLYDNENYQSALATFYKKISSENFIKWFKMNEQIKPNTRKMKEIADKLDSVYDYLIKKNGSLSNDNNEKYAMLLYQGVTQLMRIYHLEKNQR